MLLLVYSRAPRARTKSGFNTPCKRKGWTSHLDQTHTYLLHCAVPSWFPIIRVFFLESSHVDRQLFNVEREERGWCVLTAPTARLEQRVRPRIAWWPRIVCLFFCWAERRGQRIQFIVLAECFLRQNIVVVVGGRRYFAPPSEWCTTWLCCPSNSNIAMQNAKLGKNISLRVRQSCVVMSSFSFNNPWWIFDLCFDNVIRHDRRNRGKKSSVKSRGWINEYPHANNTTRSSASRGIDLYYFHEHPRHDPFRRLFATTGEVFLYREGVKFSLYRTRKARFYHWIVAARR